MTAREGAEADAGRPGRQLLAELAHELSRPLSAALNYAELALQDPELSPPTRARLERVVEAAERCGDVLRRFLELGRPARAYTEQVDLNEVVRAAVDAARSRLQHADAQLSLDLHPNLPRLSGDSQDLEALVRNLIENAAEAAEASERPEVAVTTGVVPGAVRLTVRDNGPGVPAEMQDGVFQPFFTTKGEGTGLGLTIARRIAEEHGGRIRVESGEGGGAAFVVEIGAAARLPAVAATGDQQKREPSPRAAVSRGEEERKSRVLVVDDDPSMRKLLATYLAGLGYETEEAQDGQEALERSLNGDYGLIICDVKMPRMSGPEYYQALGVQAPELTQRVVFATGILPGDENDAFLRSLPNPRLQKPYRLAALRQLIETLGER